MPRTSPSERPRLSIIIPSYNDARIADAIMSVRRFDDVSSVRLVIIDGGSKPEVVDVIKPLLAAGDYFVSEKDGGIFDALNKGLDACDTDFVGWLGSDDRFTGKVMASEVIRSLESHDLFVACMALFRNDRVRRVTHAWPCRLRLDRIGLHNPHYATFGRSELLKSERFRLDLYGSDIEYFLRVFSKTSKIRTSGSVATLMCEGGFSSASPEKIIKINRQLFWMYRERYNFPVAVVAVSLKIFYKSLGLLYFKIFKMNWRALEVS